MRNQAKILLMVLCAAGVPMRRVALPQQSISVSRAAWVKAAGNDIYDAGTVGSSQILRWRDNSMSAIVPFRQGPQESFQLLATYGTISGDFYVCYSRDIRGEPPRAFIVKLNYDSNSTEQIWTDSELYPRSIAIGPTGYIYVLGLTRKQERELYFSLGSDDVMQVNLLHIFIRGGREVKSMIPLSIATKNQDAALSVLRRSTMSFRKNGNFFLQFNPFTTRHRGWESLVSKGAVEYSPEGQVVNRYGIELAPSGSVIASLVVDADDGLIVQFVDFSSSDPKSEGITTFRWNGSKTYQLSFEGGKPEEIMKDLGRNELIMGVLQNGKIITELFGRNTVRVWNR